MVRAFVKPEGDRLQLLVRVPLEAMRDLHWPTDEEGFLDLAQTSPLLPAAASLWINGSMQLLEEGSLLARPEVLATRVALPTDRSFGSYQAAAQALNGPALPESTQIPWRQALLDVQLGYPIRSELSQFSIRPAFAQLGMRVTTALVFLPPSGEERAFQFVGDPGLVRLDPRWHQAALHFVELGFLHILDGIDHLLFLLCLVIASLHIRSLVLVVTSFTAAHSITLLAAALGMAPTGLWFPPFIETVIAVSIVYMAIENIIGGDFRHRWMLAFGFGLIHGFGFSFALQETLQFAGGHLFASLLSFNIGVEIGQLMVILLLVPCLQLLFRYAVKPRLGTIILSILVGHTAWHWMIERGQALSLYSWPELSLANAAGAARWLLAAVILAGLLWLISLFLQRLDFQNASSRRTEP